jgi:hypothetical protein
LPKNRAHKAPKPKRVRPRKTVENDENCLHMHCAKWLRDAYPALLAFHVANERQAAVQFHVKLKRKGVLTGVADWLLFPDDGRKIAIELKDDKGEQEPEQIKFQARWERTGGLYYLVRTLADFQITVHAVMMFSLRR